MPPRARTNRRRRHTTAAMFEKRANPLTAPISAPNQTTSTIADTANATTVINNGATQEAYVYRNNRWFVANSATASRRTERDHQQTFRIMFAVPSAPDTGQLKWQLIAKMMAWRAVLCRRLAPLRDGVLAELEALKEAVKENAIALPAAIAMATAADTAATTALSQVLTIVDLVAAGEISLRIFHNAAARMWRQTAMQLQVVYVVTFVADDHKEFFLEHVLPQWLQSRYGVVANVPAPLQAFHGGGSRRAQLILWSADHVMWRPSEAACTQQSLVDVVGNQMRTLFGSSSVDTIPCELVLYSDILSAPPQSIAALGDIGKRVLDEQTLLHQDTWRRCLGIVVMSTVVVAIQGCNDWRADYMVPTQRLGITTAASTTTASTSATTAGSTTTTASTSSLVARTTTTTTTANKKRKVTATTTIAATTTTRAMATVANDAPLGVPEDNTDLVDQLSLGNSNMIASSTTQRSARRGLLESSDVAYVNLDDNRTTLYNTNEDRLSPRVQDNSRVSPPTSNNSTPTSSWRRSLLSSRQ